MLSDLPMQPELPRRMNETILRRFVLQTFGRARHTQDSPITPDTWMRYLRVAEETARIRITGKEVEPPAVDLLITPATGGEPGQVALSIRNKLGEPERKRARIAQSTSRVVAALTFQQLVRFVVPLSVWWNAWDKRFTNVGDAVKDIERGIQGDEPISKILAGYGGMGEYFRFAAVVGFVQVLTNAETPERILYLEDLARRLGPVQHDEEAGEAKGRRSGEPEVQASEAQVLLEGFCDAMDGKRLKSDTAERSLVQQEHEAALPGQPQGALPSNAVSLVTLNRPASPMLQESRRTVKADAAQRVFDISTRDIAVAVIDCGIDADHPAFHDERQTGQGAAYSRIAATYDFTLVRDVLTMSDGNDPPDGPNKKVLEAIAASQRFQDVSGQLSRRRDRGRDLDWSIVAPLIEISQVAGYRPPAFDHGTHVAGILAACLDEPEGLHGPLYGVCPELRLYDLRVFDPDGRGEEFPILCAIEFVAWLNRDRTRPLVHAVNLSLALRHEIDAFACGRTPVCDACNWLVGAGTVVVAAAGNTGFEDKGRKASLGDGYRSISITDPGNADAVITVGSTHRRDPHAYGVSYFSSRGPTGDGRRKPDLLAPGEKITSTICGRLTAQKDGTSMAAPHVTGAAALLMARFPELVGQPERIKSVLMRTATDLGREANFQGAGLLDILRALQSV